MSSRSKAERPEPVWCDTVLTRPSGRAEKPPLHPLPNWNAGNMNTNKDSGDSDECWVTIDYGKRQRPGKGRGDPQAVETASP